MRIGEKYDLIIVGLIKCEKTQRIAPLYPEKFIIFDADINKE